MDHLGRVSQDEYHAALDRRDRRIAELEHLYERLQRRHAILQINHANLMARVREAGFEISEIEE